MSIKSLKLSNVGPFRYRPAGPAFAPMDAAGENSIELEFDDHINLFIGPNNVGKSTILDSLAVLMDYWPPDLSTPFGSGRTPIDSTSTTESRFTVVWNDIDGNHREDSGDLHQAHIEHGLGLAASHPRDGIFVEYYRPELWNDYLHGLWVGGGDENLLVKMGKAVDGLDVEVFAEIVEIANEILSPSHSYGQNFPVNLAINGPGGATTRDFDFLSNTIDGEVMFAALSHGTRSVLGGIFRFVLGMADHYFSGWQDKPGIFIIDEIDAHLHPSWQRRMIPTLQRHFPNVQIFASTHSPMMVAGLKKGQVHLLKRDGTGQVVWSRNEQDITGWTADEIYRTFMGIDDPTDELTVQRANRLRQLRRKESLAPEEEREMD